MSVVEADKVSANGQKIKVRSPSLTSTRNCMNCSFSVACINKRCKACCI